MKFKRVISIKSLVILVDREHYFPPIPDSFQPLPDAVDIVIIGAGIIGISTAWFLAKQGIKVLVCEKGRVAGEPSSRNWGWIRQQGRDEAELPIMMDGGYTIAMTDYLEVFPSAQSFREFGVFLPLLLTVHKKLKLRIGTDWRERFFAFRTWTKDDATIFEKIACSIRYPPIRHCKE